jgi:hypothetical protein
MCTATGCSSHCEGIARPTGPKQDEILDLMGRNDVKALNNALSKAYGKIINFEPNEGFARTFRPGSISSSPFDWALFDFLDRNGTLTINGHGLSFWRDMRQSLLNGGSFQFCSSRPDMILDEISFVSGKSFSIVAGDPSTKLVTPLKGSGVPELLLNLSRAANIRITEN